MSAGPKPSTRDVIAPSRRGFSSPDARNGETLQSIVELAERLVGMPVALWVLEPSSDTLSVREASGLPPGFVKSARAQLGRGGAARGLRRGRALPVPVPSEEGLDLGAAEVPEARTVLAAPVQIEARTEAILAAYRPSSSGGSEQLETLERFAGLAGEILRDRRRAVESDHFARLARSLSSNPNIDNAMTVIAKTARDLTGADSSAIVLVERLADGRKRFLVGSRVPLHGSPTTAPRQRHGLTEKIIDTGEPVLVQDTERDDRVNQDLRKQGFRSLLGVRLQLEENRLGVLYVESRRPESFDQRALELLRRLADQASIALGWTRLLLEPWRTIEQAVSDLYRRDGVLQEVCERLHRELGYDFVALQLIRRDQNVIETVAGTGEASSWVGRARHYLHRDHDLRDIQVDIALARPLRIEVLRGWDARLDAGVFSEFHHDQLVRIFAPLVILRGPDGESLAVRFDPHACRVVQRGRNTGRDEDGSREGWRTVIEVQQDRLDPRFEAPEIEVIGTLEGGYLDGRKKIGLSRARTFMAESLKCAAQIHPCLLSHVQETIVHQARRIAGADSASLHFPYESRERRYLYEVRSGLPAEFLEKHPPHPEGLGRRAVSERRVKLVPDPLEGHSEDELEGLRPDLAAEGIRAIAAFPLLAGEKDGVLYLHFRHPHRLREAEIGWVRLLANRAVDAIRQTTAFTEIRERGRQLLTLQSVAQDLVSNPEEPALLYKIAWSAVNTLAADLVTIYEFDGATTSFKTPPVIAGRLRHRVAMQTELHPGDAPALLVEHGEPVYAPHVDEGHPILHPPRPPSPERPKRPFVVRENIRSCAAVPLKVADEIVGVLFVNYRRTDHFDPEDRRIIAALASAAAIAIKNQRLLHSRQHDLLSITQHLLSPLLTVSVELAALRRGCVADDRIAAGSPLAVPVAFRRHLDHTHAQTDNLLDLARGISRSFLHESGRGMSLLPKSLDVQGRLRTLCERMQLTSGGDGLEFELTVEPGFPQAVFDEETFTSVMYTLVQNASKYADRDSKVEIRCPGGATDGQVQVLVRSRGEPIEPDEKEAIFQKFYRGRAVQTGRRHSGVGLGLWTARELMRAAGGDLKLRLAPEERGLVTFVVEMPAAKPATDQERPVP